MRLTKSRWLLWFYFFMVAPALAGVPTSKSTFLTTPVMNEGKRWRIGYFEGGEYSRYQQELIATVKGLMKLGWIEPTEIPTPLGEQTAPLWQWLSNSIKSDYIEFVADAHYSVQWRRNRLDLMSETVIQRLNQKNLDMMIAMGTWAGKALANNRHHTPTMIFSTHDPLAAGIINRVTDSGYEHIHATVDPGRYDRQVRMFHDMVAFKNLGIAYENSPYGRSYAALNVIEKLSVKRGFNIIRCHTQSNLSDLAQAEASVEKCFRLLAPQVDAIYVTVQGGINQENIGKLVNIANEYGVPTFSQFGSAEVRQGFLLSLSAASFEPIGEFHAKTLAKVFNGASPNQLIQFFEEPSSIAVNLKTAEMVGFNPPLLLLGETDQVWCSYPDQK